MPTPVTPFFTPPRQFMSRSSPLVRLTNVTPNTRPVCLASWILLIASVIEIFMFSSRHCMCGDFERAFLHNTITPRLVTGDSARSKIVHVSLNDNFDAVSTGNALESLARRIAVRVVEVLGCSEVRTRVQNLAQLLDN